MYQKFRAIIKPFINYEYKVYVFHLIYHGNFKAHRLNEGKLKVPLIYLFLPQVVLL